MSKEKAIEICNNLIGTINKLPEKRVRTIRFENDMFNPPLVERKFLLHKLKKYQIKYEIKDSELREILPLQ